MDRNPSVAARSRDAMIGWLIRASSRLGLSLRSAGATRWCKLALLVVVLECVYVFMISAGTFTNWPIILDYYDRLADAFRDGHLYVRTAPRPELLAASDPYDLRHFSLWMVDATLYKGRYYLYWGAAPALLQAIAKSLLGIHRTIGDQYLTFGFLTVSLVAGTVLIERIACRLFRDVPFGLVVVAVLMFALANPVPFLLASARTYEASITGGQAFALVGLVFAFEAMWSARWRLAGRGLLAGAGTAWALALHCRISLAPVFPVLVLATAWATSDAYRDAALIAPTVDGRALWKRWLRDVFWMSGPLAVGALLALVYNQARFDDWLDFGMKNQISGWPLHPSIRYAFTNATSYASRLPRISCVFPFISTTLELGASPFAAWVPNPPGYAMVEQTVGFLVAVPCTWAGLISVGGFLQRLYGKVFRADRANDIEERHRSRVYIACVVWLVLLATVPAMGPCGGRFAAMRYLGDVSNALVLLGILGLWTMYSRVSNSRWGRTTASAAIVTIGVATMLLGLSFGYAGDSGHYFRDHNPELDATLRSALSLCGAP